MERCEVIVLDEKPSELKFHKEKEVLSQISLWLPEHGWCATTLDVDYQLCRVNIKFFDNANCS